MQATVALEYRTGDDTRASGASDTTRNALLLERHKKHVALITKAHGEP